MHARITHALSKLTSACRWSMDASITRCQCCANRLAVVLMSQWQSHQMTSAPLRRIINLKSFLVLHPKTKLTSHVVNQSINQLIVKTQLTVCVLANKNE